MNRKQCLVVDHWETSPATILCSKTKFIGHKWKKISRNQSQNWLLFCCQLGSRLVSLLLGLKNCVFITLGVLTYMTWHISYRRAWVGGQRHCSSVRQVSSSFFITNSNNSSCKHSLNRWRKISQSGRSEKMNCSLHNGNILSLLMGAQKGASKRLFVHINRLGGVGGLSTLSDLSYCRPSYKIQLMASLTEPFFHGWLLYVLA